MDFKTAIFQVLQFAEKPLSAKEIFERAMKKGLITTAGKTPEATVAARIYTDIKQKGEKSVFIKVKKGKFSLNQNLAIQDKQTDHVKKENKSLIDELEEKQYRSDSPTDYEQILRDAFEFLGFEAKLIGGSGDTDVLLTANIGKESFKVNVDGKTSRSGKIIDRQIDWNALRDHKKKNEADFIIVAGHSFSGGNLDTRADEYKVTLLKTEQLIDLLKAHKKFPFTLFELKDLFSSSGECSQQISDLILQNHQRRILLEKFRIIIEEMEYSQDRIGYFTFESLACREKIIKEEIDPEDVGYIIKLLMVPFINGVKEVESNKYILSIRKKDIANIFKELYELLGDHEEETEILLPVEESAKQDISKEKKYGSRYYKWEIRGSSAVAVARQADPYEHHCPMDHFATLLKLIVTHFNSHNVVNTEMIYSALEGKEIAPNRPFKGDPEVYKIRMTLGILEIEEIISWTGSKRPIEYKLNVPLDQFRRWVNSKIKAG